MPNKQSEDTQFAEINALAIRYLSRRDYSRRQLHDKLRINGFASKAIEITLDDLEKKGYQNDARFAEMFLRSRANRGDGPFKIKMALIQKGIAESVIEQVFSESDINWLEQAHQIRQKRFGMQRPKDAKDFSKQVRYLINKGFYQQHVNTVTSNSIDIIS